MAIKKIEMQDSLGNVYYPHTDASVIKVGNNTLDIVLSQTGKSAEGISINTIPNMKATNVQDALEEVFQCAEDNLGSLKQMVLKSSGLTKSIASELSVADLQTILGHTDSNYLKFKLSEKTFSDSIYAYSVIAVNDKTYLFYLTSESDTQLKIAIIDSDFNITKSNKTLTMSSPISLRLNNNCICTDGYYIYLGDPDNGNIYKYSMSYDLMFDSAICSVSNLKDIAYEYPYIYAISSSNTLIKISTGGSKTTLTNTPISLCAGRTHIISYNGNLYLYEAYNTGKLYRYSISSDTYTLLYTFSTNSYVSGSMAVYNGKIYTDLWGSIYEYDIATGTVNIIALGSNNVNYSSAGVVIVNNNIYIYSANSYKKIYYLSCDILKYIKYF